MCVCNMVQETHHTLFAAFFFSCQALLQHDVEHAQAVDGWLRAWMRELGHGGGIWWLCCMGESWALGG